MLPLRSVRFRLTLWYVLLLAIILAAFSTGIYLALRHNLHANLDDSIEARANDLLGIIRYEEGGPTLAGSLAANSPDLGEQFVRVYDASGNLTFDTSGEAGTVPIQGSAVEKALAGRSATRSISAGGGPFRVFVVPIERDGQVAGALEVGRASDDVSDTLATLVLILAIAYPGTLAVASFGGVFLASRALSPIDRITRLARRISAEDLGQRLDLRLPH
ncbi:MAG TPA: two-component sensor histidine kinase, partial [Dehalococcoidia bacterium]|nr:two-component sensor histidine kinase [Dehalococcoidia bacterium]